MSTKQNRTIDAIGGGWTIGAIALLTTAFIAMIVYATALFVATTAAPE